MKKVTLILLGLSLAACQRDPNVVYTSEYVDFFPWTDVTYVTDVTDVETVVETDNCAQEPAGPVTQVKFASPHGNDLQLETDHHIIQVSGAPNRAYDYNVWIGDKDYSDDPDIMLRDGVAAVLTD